MIRLQISEIQDIWLTITNVFKLKYSYVSLIIWLFIVLGIIIPIIVEIWQLFHVNILRPNQEISEPFDTDGHTESRTEPNNRNASHFKIEAVSTLFNKAVICYLFIPCISGYVLVQIPHKKFLHSSFFKIMDYRLNKVINIYFLHN